MNFKGDCSLFSKIKEMLKNKEFIKLIKFCITGGINTIVDFVVYSVLVFIGLAPTISQGISFLAGTLNSYIINRSWTFKTDGKFISPQLVKFILLNLFTMIISVICVYIFHDKLLINKYLVKIIILPITTLINFIGSNLWVFKKNS